MLHREEDIGRVEGSRSMGERGTAQARPVAFEQTVISVLAAVGSLRVIVAGGDSVRQRDATADADESYRPTTDERRERGDDAVMASPSARRLLDDISAAYICVRFPIQSRRVAYVYTC